MSNGVPCEQTPPTPPPLSTGSIVISWIKDVLETILPALLIVLVVNAFLAQATRVEGQSMEPTLHNNQRLVIEKVSYRFHPPRRGDIVVFRLPNQYVPPLTERVAAMIRTVLTRSHTAAWPDPLIKRVIGLPGETVEIREGRVYINGVQLAEPYETQLTLPDLGPRVIAPGHVFVLGDNRGGSNDSRAFGEVPLSDIIGRAWFRYWPVEQIGLLR